MLLLHEFPYATMDITAVSPPHVQGTWHTKYRIVLQQYSIEISIPTKLTLESEVSVLWYRVSPITRRPPPQPSARLAYYQEPIERGLRRLDVLLLPYSLVPRPHWAREYHVRVLLTWPHFWRAASCSYYE